MMVASLLIREKLLSAIAVHPLIVTADALVMTAITAMGETGASCGLVVSNADPKENSLIGIFTESDIVRLVAQSIPLDQPIHSVMQCPVVTIQESALRDIQSVLNIFQQHRVHHLPVLDGDRLVGLLTQDVLTELLSEIVLNVDTSTNIVDQNASLRYRALMDGASDAILLANSQGNLIEVNQRAEALLGYSREELTSLHMSQIHPPESLEAARNHFRNVAQKNIGPNLDSIVLRKDGGLIPVEITGSRIELNGEYFALGIFRDISDRKQTELLLQNLSTRLELALQSAQIGTWEWDVVTNGLIWDERMYELYGVNSDDFSGAYEAWINAIHPEDLPSALEFSRQALAGEKEYNTEFRVVLKDGSIRAIKAHAIIQWNKQGEPLRMIGINYDISDRKQAEVDLQQEVLRRATIFNASSDGIHILDIEGNLLEFNDRFAQMLGYTSAEIANFNVADWDAQWTPEELHEVIRQNILNDNIFETLHRRKDGVIFPVEISRRLMEWQGEFALVCISRDISDRKQAEIALQESQHFIQQIAEASPNILYLYDIQEQRNVYTNREIYTILGYSSEEIQAMGENFVLDLMHPDDQKSALLKYYERVKGAQDHEVVETEYRMRHANGEWRWLYSRDVVFSRDVNGQVKQTIGTAQDITERKRLQQSQSRLIAILEASTDYISMSDAKGVIFWQNAELKRLCGSNLNENAMQFGLVDCHPQWAIDLLEQEAIPFAIANGSWLGETALLDAEGKEILVSQLVLVHRSSQGEIEFFSNIMRDMRVYKEYERQLERTNTDLIRATSLKDEFLANMSHELRTPLNAILGMTEGLQEGVFGTVNERQLKALKTVESSGSHLLELINDILDVSKIESGHISLDYASTDAIALCQASLIFIKQQALKKHIQIEAKLPQNLPNLWVDERRIRQVLINLLNNAVKFTLEGGLITLEATQLPPELSQTESTPQSFLRIAVTDTGIGIAPENIHKLFQPFIQIDSALNRKYTGTGLGLSLVKRIVELHGGRVGLTSEMGVGSCFTIELPYTPLSADQSRSQTLITNSEVDFPVANATDDIKPPLILLAEDNEANITTVSSYLIAKGYHVVIAKNGLEAIALAKDHLPQLILMDVQMPEMDGLEAIKQIRLDPDMVKIPIIALTALAMTGDREKCLEVGANDYLTKPVKLKQLVEIIQQLLV